MKHYKLLISIAFGLLCCIQLGVIGFQIVTYERVLKEGEAFYFDVLPFDPYDPFHGRYVTIRFDWDTLKAPLVGSLEEVAKTGKTYAILEHTKGADRIKEVTPSKPDKGYFIEVTNVYPESERAEKSTKKEAKELKMIHFSFPFDRFYMREDLAPQAEKLLRFNDEKNTDIQAKIKILNGKGVIEDLIINKQPIAQYLMSQQE